MSKIAIVSIVVVVLAMVILIALLLVLTKTNQKQKKTEKKQEIQEQEVIKIDDLLDIVANKNSTKNELSSALLKLSTSLPFPPKTKTTTLDSEQKKYLSFVLLLSSHKNADAKLIAHMDKELKIKNPAYKKEIDIYENEGINNRSKRR